MFQNNKRGIPLGTVIRTSLMVVFIKSVRHSTQMFFNKAELAPNVILNPVKSSIIFYQPLTAPVL